MTHIQTSHGVLSLEYSIFRKMTVILQNYK